MRTAQEQIEESDAMKNHTPTPMTDALINRHIAESEQASKDALTGIHAIRQVMELIEHSRELERDLAAARAEAARLRDALRLAYLHIFAHHDVTKMDRLRLGEACPVCLRDDGTKPELAAIAAALSAPVAAPAERVCRWVVDDDGVWATACGNAFLCDTGTPSENKFKCCPYCGGKIEEVRT